MDERTWYVPVQSACEHDFVVERKGSVFCGHDYGLRRHRFGHHQGRRQNPDTNQSIQRQMAQRSTVCGLIRNGRLRVFSVPRGRRRVHELRKGRFASLIFPFAPE